MANQQSKKDNNSVSALIGVSSVDGVSTVPVAVDPVTGRVLVDLAGGNTITIGAAVSGGTASQLLATDGSTNLQNLSVATYPSLTELSYVKGVTSAIQTQFTGKAATGQTFYIGTTQVAINRASAALTLAGITLTTPDIGVATATSINKVVFTAPTTAATLAFGTDNTTQTFQGTDTIVGRATTDTLTNKRITPRILSAASYTTDTGTSINGDTLDMFIVTAQAGA